ncbi:mitochondrial proton/calcium exchanger protein [Onthophagus taurus]|uniref:mitochondrial proton/calcium exchanger protein n=1 Tax=Onthophagus taurus TaxID=166361 RepID=UPI0039BDB832
MHVFLRSTVANGHYKIFKCCRHCPPNLKCVCNRTRVEHDFKLSQRHLSSRSRVLGSFDLGLLVNERHKLLVYQLNEGPTLSTIRTIAFSAPLFDKEPLKPSSKIETTVQELKKKKEGEGDLPKPVVKKPLKQRIIDELVHYYHGFRLLFIDMKISSVLVWRVLNGKTLSRREYRLLSRTVGDMFRLVPFSVFIIVPFMEFLLPVFIKLFPGMLPSTFQTATEREDKLKQSLKVKLEMAKFLQQTLEDMSAQHKDRNSQQAKEFTEWFQKVRTSGEEVSNEEILKFSKLFQDEITLDSLTRSQLVALCRVLEVQTLGTNNMLRFQLRMKLRRLAADDKMIQKEGINSLTLAEIQQACRARGMRAFGVSEARLRSQLSKWLDLSLNEKVPPSLLLLSRALMLPEAIPTGDKLKATISVLPDTIVTQTKAAIGESEGKVDNRVRLEVIKEEERKVIEERKEQRELKKQEEQAKKEVIIDKAPTLSAAAEKEMVDKAEVIDVKAEKKMEDEHIRSKDLEVLEDALDTLSKEKKAIVEKVGIEELKEHLAEYQEDVEDLNKAIADMPKPEIRESKAAQRLFKKVNRMIGKMDSVLNELELREKQLKKDLEVESTDKKKEEILKIDDIMEAIKKIKKVPDESRLQQIHNVLSKIDDDCDGSIKVEDVLKVIEFIGSENVQLSAKQMSEIIDLIDKEEILEVEEKIEKALQKEKQGATPPIQKELKKELQQKEQQKNELEPPLIMKSGGEMKVMEKVTEETNRATSKLSQEAQQMSVSPPFESLDATKKDNTKSL